MITALLSGFSDFMDSLGDFFTDEWAGLTYWMWISIAVLVVLAVILISVYASKGRKKRLEAEALEEENAAEETNGEPAYEEPTEQYVFETAETVRPAYEEPPYEEPSYEETMTQDVSHWYTEDEIESATVEDGSDEEKFAEDESARYYSYEEPEEAGAEQKVVDESTPWYAAAESEASYAEEEPRAVSAEVVDMSYEKETYTETSRPAEKVYHVSKRRVDGKWQVKASKSTKVIKLFTRYRDAIEYAKKLAINQGTRVIIHKADGTFSKISFDKRNTA